MGWISAVRPSRQPLRGFLRMRTFLNAIEDIPHAEERLKGASRSTHDVDAALVRWLRQIFHKLLGQSGRLEGRRWDATGDPRIFGFPCRFPAKLWILAVLTAQAYDYTRFFGTGGASKNFYPGFPCAAGNGRGRVPRQVAF
jgi:hypothetical protein